MTRIQAVAPLLLALTVAAPAFAQSMTGDQPGKEPMSTVPTNTNPANTHTEWSPSLPTPPVDPNSAPIAFIRAAQSAIAAGRTGEAQEAIERAESRALDRSTRPSMAGQPSRQGLVQVLAQARQTLASGDKAGTMQLLQRAQTMPEATAAAD